MKIAENLAAQNFMTSRENFSLASNCCPGTDVFWPKKTTNKRWVLPCFTKYLLEQFDEQKSLFKRTDLRKCSGIKKIR